MKDLKLLKTTRYSSNDSIKSVLPGITQPYIIYNTSNNLVQRVLKIMLTAVGSNSYYPEMGTSIRNLKKIASSTAEKKDVRMGITQVVEQTTEQIIKEQENFSYVALEELLDKIEIIDILFNKDTNNWKFKLAIYNQKGQIIVLEI